jgi:hypothetical protein
MICVAILFLSAPAVAEIRPFAECGGVHFFYP